MLLPLAITFVVILGLLIIPGKTVAPLVFTSKGTQKRLFALINLKPKQTFIDLGCGRGNLLVTAAKHYGAKAIGYEISPLAYLWSKTNALFSGRHQNIRVYLADFNHASFPTAAVVYFFLLPKGIAKLAPKLKILPAGTRIVSNTWPIAGWTPMQVESSNPSAPLYLYQL